MRAAFSLPLCRGYTPHLATDDQVAADRSIRCERPFRKGLQAEKGERRFTTLREMLSAAWRLHLPGLDVVSFSKWLACAAGLLEVNIHAAGWEKLDPGAGYLSQSLPIQHLQILDLSHNGLTDLGAQNLAVSWVHASVASSRVRCKKRLQGALQPERESKPEAALTKKRPVRLEVLTLELNCITEAHSSLECLRCLRRGCLSDFMSVNRLGPVMMQTALPCHGRRKGAFEAGFDSLLSLGKDIGNRIRCMSSKKVSCRLDFTAIGGFAVMIGNVQNVSSRQLGLPTQQAWRCVVQAFSKGA